MDTPEPPPSPPAPPAPPAVKALRIVRACAVAVVAAWTAGTASTVVATEIVRLGGPPALREPINLAFALAALALWTRLSADRRVGAPRPGSWAIGLPTGLAVGAALPALATFGLAFVGQATLAPAAAAPALAPLLFAVPLLLMHAAAEEVLLRLGAQRAVEAAAGALAGIAAGGAAFAALQALQGHVAPIEVLNGFLLGALAGVLARGPGGLFAAIGLHAAWSFFDLVFMPSHFATRAFEGPLAGAGADSYGFPLFAILLAAALGVAALADRTLRTPRREA